MRDWLFVGSKPVTRGFLTLEGHQFGSLRVRGYAGKQPNSQWWCECVCGRMVKAQTHHLRSGHTKSCGCTRGLHAFKHGHARDRSPEYRAWATPQQQAKNRRSNRRAVGC